jgi:hypothetical protein
MTETTLMGIWNGHLYTQANQHPNLKYDKVWRINWRNWWDCCLLFIEATARGVCSTDVAHFEQAWEVGDAHYARFAACHEIKLEQLQEPEGDAWEASKDGVLWCGDTPLDALAFFAEKQGGRII